MFEARKGLGHLECNCYSIILLHVMLELIKIVYNIHYSLYFCIILAPEVSHKVVNNFKIICDKYAEINLGLNFGKNLILSQFRFKV